MQLSAPLPTSFAALRKLSSVDPPVPSALGSCLVSFEVEERQKAKLVLGALRKRMCLVKTSDFTYCN